MSNLDDGKPEDGRGRPLDGGACGEGCGSSCGTGTPPMSEEEIVSNLLKVPDWKRETLPDGSDTLTATFEFEDEFALASFIVSALELSRNINHHADIDIRYVTAHIRLTTNSAKRRLTDDDFRWAERASDFAS